MLKTARQHVKLEEQFAVEVRRPGLLFIHPARERGRGGDAANLESKMSFEMMMSSADPFGGGIDEMPLSV